MAFTTHGHQILGTIAEDRPKSVARCGGPGLCSKCTREAARYPKLRPSGDAVDIFEQDQQDEAAYKLKEAEANKNPKTNSPARKTVAKGAGVKQTRPKPLARTRMRAHYNRATGAVVFRESEPSGTESDNYEMTKTKFDALGAPEFVDVVLLVPAKPGKKEQEDG